MNKNRDTLQLPSVSLYRQQKSFVQYGQQRCRALAQQWRICLYRCLLPVYIRGVPSEKESKFPCKYMVSPHYACYSKLFHLHLVSNSRLLLYTSLGITCIRMTWRIGHDQTAKFKFANILVSRFSDKIAKFLPGNILLLTVFPKSKWK